MTDLQKYKVLDTSLNATITIMRDLFGDDYSEWKNTQAKNSYIDLLNVIDKIWVEERKLKEKK